MNLIQQRRARELLQALRQFQLGRTRSVEAVELARNFDFNTEVSAWVGAARESRIGSERITECENAPCSIDILVVLPGQYVVKDWFPRKGVSRHVPLKVVFARIGVTNGVVSRVSALVQSHEDKPYYEAASVMYLSEGTPRHPTMEIEERAGHFTGGFFDGNYHSVDVRADESVPFDRVRQVFDFDPKCLGLWAHCDACEIAKAACDERDRTK